MSDRLPPIPQAALTAQQKSVEDILNKELFAHFQDTFTTHNEGGSPVGIFAHFLYFPESVASGFAANYRSLGNIPNLPPQCREIAVLAVGEHFGAPYELYAHARLAKKVGLPNQKIQDILDGKPPSEASEQEVIAWQIARQLVGPGNTFKKGQLSEDLWKRGEAAFGRDGMGALMHFIGFYAYTCIILNAIAATVPEGETIWPIPNH
ncbi:hypothetical protein TWF102_005928 [Orbilia oligospora]|uniref:Carboxymuconolactone decarboxylase-like domain-containing protein n=1 Tax=Orbilia oligospora TaxID=2813651 RepID=A0A7C8NCB3_ORBOL|nr:hypothetical protein TWF102_005928 [Orbilia oligospora]KAF3108144.1 hypothetical protein TWF103_005700 [Orbilia oligospora]